MKSNITATQNEKQRKTKKNEDKLKKIKKTYGN